METLKLTKTKLFKNIDEKIFIKIVSPNFDLEYGLSLKRLKIGSKN